MIWNLAEVELERDAELPEGHRFLGRSLSDDIGARKTGVAVYELPPGEKQWPYHWHLLVEECLFVIDGEVVLRTPDGERLVRTGDVACFPAGPAGAHTVRNDSDETVRFVMSSSQTRVGGGAVYPDSGKIGFHTTGFSFVGRLGDAAEYWDGVA